MWYIVACGLVAEYFFEKYLRVPVEVEYASEFRYRFPIINEGDVVFVIPNQVRRLIPLRQQELQKRREQ